MSTTRDSLIQITKSFLEIKKKNGTRENLDLRFVVKKKF